MANCINPDCRITVADDWNFCPKCGEDNRPPEHREKLEEHHHFYPSYKAQFCTYCGDRRYRDEGMSDQVRCRIGWSLIGSASLPLLALLFIPLAEPRTTGLLAGLGQWARTVTERTGKGGRVYYESYGTTTMTFCGLIAFLLILFGIVVIVNPQTGRNRSGPWSDDV